MIELRRVVEVNAMDDFSLECKMENGEIYRYEMSFIREEKGTLIVPLKNIKFFKKVWIEYGALEWPNGFGIHGDTVVRHGKLVSQQSSVA